MPHGRAERSAADSLQVSFAVTRTRARVFFLIASVIALVSCATTDLYSQPQVQSYRKTDIESESIGGRGPHTLRVMTINVAHGRGDGLHQLLQGSDATLANLDNIAALLENIAPDVVALQEADGPSFWSGNFNHVEYLASRGGFRQSVRASQVDGMGLSYGTALIANLDLSEPEAITFDPELTPVPKGFVVSTIAWPGQPCVEVDIVSVHLDFSSQTIRKQQARELIERLHDRNRPAIVMGDLNAEWQPQASVVRYLARQLELAAYRPDSGNFSTFRTFSRRLDWILVSSELRFLSYRVIPDVVSDHRGVVADLALETVPEKTANRHDCALVGLSPGRATPTPIKSLENELAAISQ